MKRKKITAVTCMGVLLFLLCGTVAASKGIGDTALQKVQEAESVQTDMTVELEIKVMGMTLKAGAENRMIAHREQSGLQWESTLDLGLLGKAQHSVYARQKEGAKQAGQKQAYELYSYTGDGKKGWQYQEVRTDDLRCYHALEMMETYLEQIQDWKLIGTSKLNGGEAYVYQGVIRGSGLKEILLGTGSLEEVRFLLEETRLKYFGIALSGQEKLEEMMKNAKDMPVTVWIHKNTGAPVRYEVDVAKMLNEGYQELVLALPEKKVGYAGMKLLKGIEITGAKFVVTCKDYGTAPEILIPREALAAKK